MLAEVAVSLISILFLVMFTLHKCRRASSMPPGPGPLPFLGNFLSLLFPTRPTYLSLHLLAQKYGDIFSVRFGSADIVILSRPPPEVLEELTSGIHTDSLVLGATTTTTTQELRELTSTLKCLMADGHQTVVHIPNLLHLSVLNFFWAILTPNDTRFGHDDPELFTLQTLVQKAGSSHCQNCSNLVLPGVITISTISRILPTFRKLCCIFAKSESVTKDNDYKAVENFLQTGQAFESTTPFLQSVLEMQQNSTSERHPMLTDLLVAASNTTSSTLAYAILYMILHPEVQDKVHREIKSVVGSGPDPVVTLDQRSRLAYTEAVLLEIQRVAVIHPLTLLAQSQSPKSTTTVANYKLPKNTPIMVNAYSHNMNESYWEDPRNFRPERFLRQSEGIRKIPSPFHIGIRNKLLATVAEASCFRYFATLLLYFRFETVPGHLDPPTEPVFSGSTLAPKPFNVVVNRQSLL